MRAAASAATAPRYYAALRQAHLTIADARAIIVARLQRDLDPGALPPARADRRADRRLPRDLREPAGAPRPRDREGALARRHHAGLGGRRRSRRPASSRSPAQGAIDTTDGSFTVTPLGPVLPLGLVPRAQARAAAKAALERLAREKLYRSWLHAQEQKRLTGAVCLNDRMPTPSPTDLSPFVPFLLPS